MFSMIVLDFKRSLINARFYKIVHTGTGKKYQLNIIMFRVKNENHAQITQYCE